MSINEVIANRTNEITGFALENEKSVSPNDEHNLTAIRLENCSPLLPVQLGQAFGVYALAVRNERKRIESFVNLGITLIRVIYRVLLGQGSRQRLAPTTTTVRRRLPNRL
jgi:aspartate ammonia-lyase